MEWSHLLVDPYRYGELGEPKLDERIVEFRPAVAWGQYVIVILKIVNYSVKPQPQPRFNHDISYIFTCAKVLYDRNQVTMVH